MYKTHIMTLGFSFPTVKFSFGTSAFCFLHALEEASKQLFFQNDGFFQISSSLLYISSQIHKVWDDKTFISTTQQIESKRLFLIKSPTA
jgi:hypothetical protein